MAWQACLSSLFLIVVCFKKKKKKVLIWLCWVLAAECRISCCGEWVSSVVPGLGCPVALWHLSSPTRDQTCIPCVGRWILNHWTTREVPWLLVMREKRNLGKAQGWAPCGRARSGQRASCPC